MNPLEPIFLAFDEGRPALLVTGRSLYDHVAPEDEEGKIRPFVEVLRREVRQRYGMVLVSYSLAGGIDWGSSLIENTEDRRTIEGALRTHNLLNVQQDQNELVRVIRGVSSLARTPAKGLKWVEGKDLRFLLLVEFAEHLVPGGMGQGTQTDTQLVAIELAHLLGHSQALRGSRNAVIFHGRDGLVDDLVVGSLHPVCLKQPDHKEKDRFVQTALSVYASASFEDGLDAAAISHLTVNTPNRGLESILRASHKTGRKISAKLLSEQKQEDVKQISEHTLAVLDTSRVENTQLCGRNIARPQAILERYGDALFRGASTMPGNVLLVGSPGNGKTDLAIIVARKARAAAYQMLSPKGGIVGETERKARLQQAARREWTPNVSFVDEVTEALPLERSDFDGDSGASRAVTASLLTALSDENLRGRSLLVATTNCPWRMGSAMRSRFTVIPVLHPLLMDFPEIVVATARRVVPVCELDPANEKVREAAAVFFSKGLNPRVIRGALSDAVMIHGEMTPEVVLYAAYDACESSDLASSIYADLWAIKTCTSRSFFPWADNPADYPYPDHLQSLVDPSTGNVRYDELEKRIEELKPHAKL
jgi:AAA+ superfamily predicted ATPase